MVSNNGEKLEFADFRFSLLHCHYHFALKITLTTIGQTML